TMQLPALAITPKPIDLGRNVTWSPGFSLTNSLDNNTPITPGIISVTPGGVLDTLGATTDKRTTLMNLDTPLRFGGFTWRNSFSYNDSKTTGRTVIGGQRVPDPTTPDPTDSITVSQVSIGDFASQLDWQTGINLPTVFSRTWKVQPSLGISNATGGPFLIRNRNTGGNWVRQGKRFNLGITASPTFFGFFPGFGPIARIRHSFSPIIQYSYSPAAGVPRDYAQAIALPGQTPQLRSLPVQLLSVGLSQNFEGKARPAPGDTSSTSENARKLRILGISTSPIQYDFEQAKLPGRTGWKTQTITNQFQSDLLPGFNLSLTHDLWRGAVGTDSAHFSPFLQAVTASFAISGGTVRSVLGLFGLGHRDTTASRTPPPPSYVASQTQYGRPPSFYGYGSDQTIGVGANRRFTANFNYSLARQRRVAGVPPIPSQQSLGFSTAFAPTAFWSVSWSTQYNITANKFESQVVRLERVLHEWRAAFNFVRNPNGNFAFYFSVYLNDLQDVKFDYNQTSIER
ncbi:MAG TPA: putative LPS assembly protein LptD, partial [Gemmatimonadales bacterium]|nr:putative LPS assembly protein LptD [Gemmatimonadales bacterium]